MKLTISRLQREKSSHIKAKSAYLVFIALISICLVIMVMLSRHQAPTDYSNIQLDAATRMQNCLDYIKQYVLTHNITIEAEDINQTGLIGPEMSPLMTTLGHLEAKRTSLNPNNAALMVKYFHQAGLHQGDTIAIGSSGSFPGLAIATLCAANAMGLNDRTIVSYGASTYGATRVEFNIVTILRLLQHAGLLSLNLLAVSPGGNLDRGIGALDGILYDDTRSLVLTLASHDSAELLDFPNLQQDIDYRLTLYGSPISLFVNIGGADVNTGTSLDYLDIPPGLSLTVPTIPDTGIKGLIYEYAAQGIPIINLLNIKAMSLSNDLPIDPVPLPPPGQGSVYLETTYHSPLIALSLTLLISTLAILFSHAFHWPHVPSVPNTIHNSHTPTDTRKH